MDLVFLYYGSLFTLIDECPELLPSMDFVHYLPSAYVPMGEDIANTNQKHIRELEIPPLHRISHHFGKICLPILHISAAPDTNYANYSELADLSGVVEV